MATLTRKTLIALALGACGPLALATNFLGVEHTNVGGASSALDPNGSLLVSGLAAGPGAGVDALVGRGEFFIFDTTLFNPAATISASQSYKFIGDEPGDPNQTLGTLSFTDGGSSLLIGATFASGPPTVVEVFNGGMMVASGLVTSPEVASVLPISGTIASAKSECFRDGSRFRVRLPATAIVTIFGGPTVSGDEVRARPATPLNVLAIRRVEMRGSGIPSFRLRDELVGKFGSAHRGAGPVELTYLGDCPTCEIEIANPTPSVIGGIDVETRGLRSFEQTWQNLGTLVEGARLRFAATGRFFSGPSPREVGWIEAEDTGGRIEISANFAGLSATGLRFEFYNAGAAVGTVVGQPLSAVAKVIDSEWPDGAFTHRRLPTTTAGVSRATFGFLWDAPLLIDPPGGGGTFTADEIRVIPEGPGIPGPTEITTINVTEEEIPDQVIDGETPDPGCDGDINGDDLVDLSDLAGMLAAFGTCEGDPNYAEEANLNPDEDGCIDLGDLAGLLANFGGCP